MPKKLTYEDVKEFIENEGYSLLSDKYVNSQIKLQVRCPKGHTYLVKYNNFKNGSRCPHCYNENFKLTYEQVKENIESFDDYTLLSDKYVNWKTKLQVRCPKGHEYWVTYYNFKGGRRCPICAVNKTKLTYEDVKEFIESEGYILLSKDYVKYHNKLQVRCHEGHEYLVTYGHFKNGSRCPHCDGQFKLTYEDVKEFIESEGYTLLSDEYKNNCTKLQVRCPEGHEYWVTYDNFKSGCRCPYCAGKAKLTNQEIVNRLKLYNDIRENNNEIEVRCIYCGKYHIPEIDRLKKRIGYVNGNSNFESNFYCSNNCKSECPIYNQKLYPKGHKPATSREVQPQLRKLVFERDNYICQKCNTHKNDLETGLHCHHIDAIINNPIESADIDNCITLCKECHKEVHKIPGCGYHELRCTKEEKEEITW